MNAQERLDYLLESVFVPSNKLVTIGMIKDALPEEAYGLVLATFAMAKIPASAEFADVAKAAEMESSFIAMSSEGLSLSSLTRQAVIDQLAAAGGWPDVVRDAVKALGGVWQPRWEIEGYAAEPTLEQVTTELRKIELEDAAVDRLQAFRETLSAWDGSGEEPVL
jgi:hypothetical protein